GMVNLILGALILESGRMLKEGYKWEMVEESSKKAFLSEKGVYSIYQELGNERVIPFLKSLIDEKEKEFSEVYHNFFTLRESIFMDKRKAGQNDSAEKKEPAVERGKGEDSLVLDILSRRFLAVAFMLASEIVEAGVAEFDEVDLGCQKALGWKKGPFSLMNDKGLPAAFQMVVEKMENSHRREINFPVPSLLVSQVQKNTPWPLASESGFYH
ncbi:MAG: 3-hydroxyacyl-CoA dehydrogenase family protein, partial [Acidobacteriota bacterium]